MPASERADQAGPYEVAVSVTGLWAAPDAPRPLDAALTDARPRPADWLAAQGPTQRQALWGLLESQLLLGERVIVHEVSGGWARASAPSQPSSLGADGYPGFIPAHHLRPAAESTGRSVVVHQPVTAIRATPDAPVLLSDVSFATVLPMVEEAAGWVAVQLPGDGAGCLPGSHVEGMRAPGAPPSGEELVAAGRRFLGVGYLAGGMHGLSYDCSGLVHALYRRFGQTVPRDARDQLAVGAEVAVHEAGFGDLMFFTHPERGEVYHVGFCAGTRHDVPLMLHASQTDWSIVDAPVPQWRRDHLSHVRRLRLCG